jgi:hypothetical protein
MKNHYLLEFMKKTLLLHVLQLCFSYAMAQKPSPKSHVPHSLGFEIQESYLRSVSVFYTYPSALNLLEDFTALDIDYMQPSKERVRVYNGVDEEGQTAFYNEFVEVKHQGLAQMPPPLSIKYLKGKFTLTSADGTVTEDAHNYQSEEAFEDPIALQNLMNIRPQTLKDGRLKYDMDSLVVLIDKTHGSVFMNVLDEEGIWLSQVFIQYDTQDERRSVPLVELAVERDFSPSGNCIFRIQETQYSQYEKGDRITKRESEEKGISDQVTKELEILPNPATDKFTLLFPDWSENEEYLLEIFSLDGKKMYEAKLRNPIHMVDSSLWPQGLYAARVLGQNKIRTAKIIIK